MARRVETKSGGPPASKRRGFFKMKVGWSASLQMAQVFLRQKSSGPPAFEWRELKQSRVVCQPLNDTSYEKGRETDLIGVREKRTKEKGNEP
nr:hypothetical protein Iba_chr09cCG9580 [Ipomoea batatas]